MISFIHGKIKHKKEKFVIIETGNLGFKVFISDSVLDKLEEGEEADLYTFLYIREDALELYGFPTTTEEELFELLTSVSGIGPKAGLGILSLGSADDIKNAISNEDSTFLSKVSGIGKKIAERLILELKNKVGMVSEIKSKGGKISSLVEALEALENLGYSTHDAKKMLEGFPRDLDASELVKKALQGRDAGN